MVKIRLNRMGAKKRPFYRVHAIDERKKRNGRALEMLGTYDPGSDPVKLELNTEAIDAWVAKGAQMSETVRSLVKQAKAAQPAAEA